MTNGLYILDQEGEVADRDDERCRFDMDDRSMRRMCHDMETLGMLQADGSSTGIPKETLCSSEGWVVSTQAISQSLEAFGTCDAEDLQAVREHWQDGEGNRFDAWIEFLRLAEGGGGLQVW